MKTPKILVISNQCFSDANSNGRTLQGFFAGWPTERIAQFYIHGDTPDFSVCKNFFCITDRDALNAFLGKGKGGGEVSPSAEDKPSAGGKPARRSPLTMLLRELVWSSRRWISREFKAWVRDFSPELILLQAGDCAFMFRIARKLAEHLNIPLVIYNSEGYYFKKFDYFKSRGIAHALYPVFRRLFCREFRKTMARASHAVYICPALKQDYDSEFATPSTPVFTATDVAPVAEKPSNPSFIASYLGNLGVGRHEVLVEVANALQAISPELHLNVYGRIPDETVRSAFDACPGIRFKGFVSYSEVVDIMHRSDLLLHAENFSRFYREDLKYAFSTKIADSLACGTCFLLYAPEDMACTRYLRENAAAYVVSDPADLAATLKTIVEDPSARGRYLPHAQQLVMENHRAEVCAAKFRKVLSEAAESYENSSGKLRVQNREHR